MDPPYDKLVYYDLVQSLVEKGCMSESAIIVCEHEKNVTLEKSYGDFELVKKEIYGGTVISIYRCLKEEEN